MKARHPMSRQIDLERMRLIDVWAGVPLCAMMTLWDRFVRFFNRPVKKPVRRILLIKLSEVGALVQTYPLLNWLRRTYPQAEISFLVFEKNISFMNMFGQGIVFSRIYGIRDESLMLLLASTWKVLGRIMRDDIDVVIDLEFFSRFTALLSRLSHAATRVGFHCYSFEGLYRGDLFTHKVPYNPLQHCSRMYLAMGKTLAMPSMGTPGMMASVDPVELVFPFMPPHERDIACVKEKLGAWGLSEKRLYLVNPGEGILPMREWPIENYCILVKRILAQDPSHAVIIIGRHPMTGKDRSLAEMVDDPRCVNWSAATDMNALMALFHASRALICNDGGLSHMASLTPLRTVVLFGPESPQVFAPAGPGTRILFSAWACSPCLSVLNHRVSHCRDNFCLQAISVEDVFSAVMGPDKPDSGIVIEQNNEGVLR